MAEAKLGRPRKGRRGPVLLNGAKVGSVLASHAHGPLRIVDIAPEEEGVLCVICTTRAGFEVDLSAAYAGKLPVLCP